MTICDQCGELCDGLTICQDCRDANEDYEREMDNEDYVSEIFQHEKGKCEPGLCRFCEEQGESISG